MTEIELKFQIPADRRDRVRRAVATARSEQVRLQARYFDTPDRRLATAGLALRLRREGRRWVQTLKGRGDGLMQRLEHEVVVPGRGVPALNLSLHAGTVAGAALIDALGSSADALGEIFSTDIRRTRRRVRVAGGVVVELALDEGEICAGSDRLPVCELEFELLRGPAAALPALAASWVQRHGIWLDPRSKAQRGERLAAGVEPVPAIKAGAPLLRPDMSGDDALRAMLASGLHQVLANACELADGRFTPEHLHQCRIGMRRLRCALRDFGPLAGELEPATAALWQEELRVLFRRLGGARDRDALREKLVPALLAAGAPSVALPESTCVEEDAGAVMREAGTTRLWLAILGFVQAGARTPGAATAQPLQLCEQFGAVLRELHHRVAKDAAQFETLGEAAQHRTRKRLKRLRYGVEFCSALYPPKAVLRYLEVLRPAQDALGDGQDLIVARALFEPELATNPHAWFVLGWLAGHRPVLQARCVAALARIAQTHGFWGRSARH